LFIYLLLFGSDIVIIKREKKLNEPNFREKKKDHIYLIYWLFCLFHLYYTVCHHQEVVDIFREKIPTETKKNSNTENLIFKYSNQKQQT
jgi:hypothetical protein